MIIFICEFVYKFGWINTSDGVLYMYKLKRDTIQNSEKNLMTIIRASVSFMLDGKLKVWNPVKINNVYVHLYIIHDR